MGLYRVIGVSLPCEGCGGAQEWLVQYKTGDDHGHCSYVDGGPIDDDDDIQGERFEGSTDSFCDACHARWAADERRIALDDLAKGIESGLVEARRGEESTPLTGAEIRALDRIAFPDVPRANTSYFLLQRARIARIVVAETWNDGHRQRVRVRLGEAGWRAPADQTHRDCVVWVDRDRRIHVRARGPEDDDLDW